MYMSTDEFISWTAEKDNLLYHALANILLSNPTEMPKAQLHKLITQFAYLFPTWIWDALKKGALPPSLFDAKIREAIVLSKHLSRVG